MGLLKSTPVEPQSCCKTILLGGEAGEGVKSAGQILAAALIKAKHNVFVYDEYPSLIRGGHNSVNVTYSPDPVYAPNREIDILICLNRETFDQHKHNLHRGSIVLYDNEIFRLTDEDVHAFPCELVEVPVSGILKREKLPRITKNMVMVAAGLCIAGLERETVIGVIKKKFADKADAIAPNTEAVNQGYDTTIEYYGLKKFEQPKSKKKTGAKTSKKQPKQYLISGNDAAGLGALRAGIQFYAAYPMTPASTLLDFMINHYREYDFMVKQTEDEIAAINMAVGAAFAGARAMVGTSGGGFSLMVEGLGLAAITETPLVIFLAQRPGPATGLPTWTGQADLLFTLHASQDEFPRIILTPTDAEECFTLTFKAFNLAEKYQVPVFVLSDRLLSESLYQTPLSTDALSDIDRGLLMTERQLDRIADFNRYEDTPNGVSPRSIPGQKNGIYLANSDEGDSKGYTSESAENRIQKVHKRFKKLPDIVKDMPELNVYGDIRSKLCIITWGSTKGPALEAMRRLQSIGVTAKLLALNYVEPFPAEEVEKFIKTSKYTFLIEGNFTSQLGQLIMQHTGYEIDYKLLKYDGRPHYPDEIVRYILKEI